MSVFKLMPLLAFFIGLVAHTADMSFQKGALQSIAGHFAKKKLHLPNTLDEDALKYLHVSIKLYKKVITRYPSPITSFWLQMVGSGTTSLSMDGFSVKGHGDGTLSVNGVRQKLQAKNLSELETALKNGHWITIQNCLTKIAVAAQKVLIASQSEEMFDKAKHYATDSSTPSELRTELFKLFAEVDKPECIEWLLSQKDFKGTEKDHIIQKLVDRALKENDPGDAAMLVDEHLESGYSAQKLASQKIFHYYLENDDLRHAEKILIKSFKKGYNPYHNTAKKLFSYHFDRKNFMAAEKILEDHFSKGYPDYEKLAETIFYYHLKNDDFAKAEKCLRHHYYKGYSATNALVHVLVKAAMKQKNFDKARVFAESNMTRGSSEHTKLERDILEEQIKYLKKLVQ